MNWIIIKSVTDDVKTISMFVSCFLVFCIIYKKTIHWKFSFMHVILFTSSASKKRKRRIFK